MTPPPEGTPWWAWLLAVILLAVISAASSRLATRPLHREVTQVRTQVQNSHETNLRDDIDEMRKEIRAGFEETREDIGGIRSEIRTERRERAALGDRVTQLEHHK